MVILLVLPVCVWADVVKIDGVAYPRDPFLTPQEQVKIFEEIRKEWTEFHRKLQPVVVKKQSELPVVTVPEQPTREAKFPKISIDAILSSLDIDGHVTKWVLIDGRLLREGDVLDNITIEKIASDRVVVRWMGKDREVKVGSYEGKGQNIVADEKGNNGHKEGREDENKASGGIAK